MMKLIDYGKVQLITELYRMNFEIKAYKVPHEPDKVYALGSINHNLELYCSKNTLQGVKVSDIIKNIIITRANEALTKYLEDNVNNHAIYHPVKNYWDSNLKEFNFLRLLYEPEYKFDLTIDSFDIEELEKGILKVRINDLYCELDLATNDLIIWHRNQDRGDNYNLLNFFGNLGSHLARYQISKDTAHPTYKELYNLSQFLSDKKSVKILIEGKEYTAKAKSNYLTLSSILELDNLGNLTLNEYRVEGLNKKVDINSVDCFKFGKQVFKFDNPIQLPTEIIP